MTTVVGLDPSLTSSGLARTVFAQDHAVAETWKRGVSGITTKPHIERSQDIAHICADIVAWTVPCDLVVIEEMISTDKSASTVERAWLWGRVYDRLIGHEIPVLVVHPSVLKRYATGKGNASKGEVGKAVARMWPEVVTVKEDEDDALALASLGMHLMGGPCPFPLTKYRTEVVSGLSLPEKEAA